MLSKIRKVKFHTEGKNPNYKVILESPEGKELYVHFDYTHATKTYWPLEVSYDGKFKDAKLAWYTREIEGTKVAEFLESIAKRVNKKYGYTIE
ncbi:hypothetical protein [Peribacillus glennii]|uniref:Uncharacterized protein n=1 Tax=Peribacillus glennii TaxID=2303991 RepID=A0A372LGB2_9BACI|nr:hypothetical protein [Peribacillus glennii]RFU65034.1 hypothetical protein D0466_03730 [Peribacillus glennii]